MHNYRHPCTYHPIRVVPNPEPREHVRRLGERCLHALRERRDGIAREGLRVVLEALGLLDVDLMARHRRRGRRLGVHRRGRHDFLERGVGDEMLRLRHGSYTRCVGGVGVDRRVDESMASQLRTLLCEVPTSAMDWWK